MTLEGNDIGEDGAQAMIDYLPTMDLVTLNLGDNPKIGAEFYPAFCTAIANSPVHTSYLWSIRGQVKYVVPNTNVNGGISEVYFPSRTDLGLL